MIEKQIACPICKQIITVKGMPLEKIIITCPSCKTKGIFQFDEESVHNSSDFHSIIKLLFMFFFISLLIVFSINIFQTGDLFLVFISFILVPIFVFFKFDVRIPFIYALFLLFIAGFQLVFYKENLIANQLATNSYWLIVVGVLCYLVACLQKYGKSRNQKSVC